MQRKDELSIQAGLPYRTKGEANNPKRVGSLFRGRPGETMTEGREMESTARRRLIRVAAHPAGAEGIGTRIPAQEGKLPVVLSLFLCRPRNLSREVGVGEGRERKRGDGEEESRKRRVWLRCAVAVGKVRKTRAPVAFKPLRSRHFRILIIDSHSHAALPSACGCGRIQHGMAKDNTFVIH